MTLIEEVRSRPRPPSPRRARAIRERAKVSQERMAAELGVHRVTLARWETGSRTPSGELLDAYLALLDDLSRATA